MTETGKTLARPWNRFIEALAETGNVASSCRATGIPRTTAYRQRDCSPKFKSDWDEAIDIAVDLLEGEARRRAIEGVLEPVFQQGKKVGVIRRYSDKLLELLLKAHKPDKYRESPLSGRKANTAGATVHYHIDI